MSVSSLTCVIYLYPGHVILPHPWAAQSSCERNSFQATNSSQVENYLMAVSVEFKVCVTCFVLCYKVGHSIRNKNPKMFLINTPINFQQ